MNVALLWPWFIRLSKDAGYIAFFLVGLWAMWVPSKRKHKR